MRALAWIALGALALGGAYQLGTRHAANDTTRTVLIDRSAAAPQIITRAVGTDADQLRAIIREELAHAAASPTGTEPRAESPPDPAADAGFERARSVVRTAMAAHVWTEADRTAVRSVASTLSQAQLEELNRTIFPALNNGTLRVAFDGLPL